MPTIRKLTPTDVATYRQIRLECLKNHPDNFGSTYEEESAKPVLFFETNLANNDPDKFMYGAFDGENCIGICGFVREERYKTKHRGEIVQMYVHADYAGKGVGKALILNTVAEAFKNPAVTQIVLSAVYSNLGAFELYKKVGFKEYGMIKNYFIDQDRSWDQRFMVMDRDV